MNLKKLDQDRLYDAIRQGVADGIYMIATSATQMPGTDFYEEIKAGVKEAIKELGRAGMLRGATDENV
jgi:hypothetical protein